MNPISKGAPTNTMENVGIVQSALDLIVNEKVIDNGHYGAYTNKLVKGFQEKVGLPITGTIDEISWIQIKSNIFFDKNIKKIK